MSSAIRHQFPLIHNQNLSYLDSAASSQKPQRVIDRITRYYSSEHANIHRGLYSLSEEATQAFENARETVACFLGATDSSEVIFTRGCTEAINLVASSWGSEHLGPGDEVILSGLEHHANIVPWQLLQKKNNFQIRFIRLTKEGRIDRDHYHQLLNKKTKLVSITHLSNVLGWLSPVKEMIASAHEVGAKVLVDGAQATPHLAVDVGELDADFYGFSSHKMCGPTGVGVLWGKQEILQQMAPYQGGGDMILSVTTEGHEAAQIPHKFEAGTPHIAGVLGLEEAIHFLKDLDRPSLLRHERHLAQQVMEGLTEFKDVAVCHAPESQEIPDDWMGTISLYHQKIHVHDLACFLDQVGVCVRAGHHCAMPLHKQLGIGATLRVSLYIYNNQKDIERFLDGLGQAEKSLIG